MKMNRKIFVSLFMLCVATTTSFVASRLPIFARHSLRPAQVSQVSLCVKTDGTKGTGTNEYLKTLSIQKIMNTSITSRIKNTECEQINITSVYLNIDKVKAVYFAKDVKNVIFTLPYDLSDLYYYDKDAEIIYKISNKTRINMKNLNRFVFQSFNNNVDGILF
jgi:hypothetical protein